MLAEGLSIHSKILHLIGKSTNELSGIAKDFYHDYKKIAEKIHQSTASKFNYILIEKTDRHLIFGMVRTTKIIDQNNEVIGFINLITRIRYCLNIIYMIANSTPSSSFIQINNPADYDRLSSPLEEAEQIICWLLTLNKSLKEISFTLEEIYEKQFPNSTLSGIIYRKICSKFNVKTIEELIKHLYENNILSSIPQKLFTHLTDK